MSDFETSAKNPVFMLSGQGAQKPGMGSDLFDVPEVSMVFECASDVLGYDVAEFIQQADPEKLQQTVYAQATLATLSIGIAQALRSRVGDPKAVLGFSLGQISALAVSGMLNLPETFELVKVRSELMAEAAQACPGKMCALLGASEKEAFELCETCAEGDVLVVANFNSPGQIVIAGTVEAVDRAQRQWKAQKKRSAELATSGAFHSPLMNQAAEQLDSYLSAVTFNDPVIPLISNTDTKQLTKENAREQLVAHLTQPVLFYQSAQSLQNQGAQHFVEVGYGGVLFGLIKRIDKALNRVNVCDRATFENYCLSQES